MGKNSLYYEMAKEIAKVVPSEFYENSTQEPQSDEIEIIKLKDEIDVYDRTTVLSITTTVKDEILFLSPKIVAEDRANYYAVIVDEHKEGSKEYYEEVLFSIKNEFELTDWFANSSDLIDWSGDLRDRNGNKVEINDLNHKAKDIQVTYVG